MKKLIVIPFLVLSVGVFAQKFQFGLKAGANLSNFTGVDWDNIDTKARVGFHGGAFLNLLFGDHFMLSPEALFSTQGATFKNTGAETDYKVSYLAVPVLLRYRFNGGFYVEAGPQVSFKLDEDKGDLPVDKFAKDLDLAISGGIGWHSNGGFGIGARYVAGISKVGDFDENAAANPNFKNGVAQLSLFYTLFNNNRD